MLCARNAVSFVLLFIFIHPTRSMPQSGSTTINPINTPTHPAFRTCDELVCASRISACQLMQSCNCQLPECECCADCTRCLGSLWSDCCDCLGLCLAHISRALPFHAVSTFGQVASPIPSLFDALSYGTEGAVFISRPQSTLPDTFSPKVANMTRNSSQAASSALQSPQTVIQVGTRVCKVAFFDACCSLDKCKRSCQSMGASRFRWFHNGCCQCVGDKCVDNGGPKSLCKNCMH